MGIASLVSTGRPEVLERLPTEIFNLWLDVFGEIKEVQLRREEEKEWSSSSSPSPTSLIRYWELSEAPASYYKDMQEGTPEYDRRKTIYEEDPVRNAPLTSFVANSLREAEALCGPTQFQSIYLAKADPTVLAQIQNDVAKS